MRRVLALVFVVLIGSIGIILFTNGTLPFSKELTPLTNSIIREQVTPSEKKTYLFVPYWTFGSSVDDEGYDSLLYFGVGVDENGIDKEDDGYKRIGAFMAATNPEKERILTIRMTDASVNSLIIADPAVQEEIINESIMLAKEYGYDGILLDFETSAFGFENTVKNISNFYTRYSTSVKGSNLLFYVSLFGDTYYRARAYDVERIGALSDKVLVMTYDFHKSRGNPGPNFPLRGRGEYGYDLDKMVEEYQRDVDNEKLVIVLGFFGYDWEVNSRGEALSNGEPLSTNKIQQDFVTSCVYQNCSESRNSNREPFIEYADEDGVSHVVWFEDEVSVREKLSELSKMGVNQTGVWAYSYY